MKKRREAKVERKTNETSIVLEINLDGTGCYDISTGLGFFDHMLSSLSKHSKIDLKLKCIGDLEVDDHHTVEDCGIAIGEAFSKALGEKRGIKRFASKYAPLDEAVCRAIVDISGRAYSEVNLCLERENVGQMSCENIPHFFSSFANSAQVTLHIDVIKGENDHHKSEAAFKALALALSEAVIEDGSNTIPSTKGVL